MSQYDDGGIGGLLVAAVVLFFIFAPVSWTNAVWYGVKFKVSPSEVDTDTKPTDCDFMHAPLGNKDCSYKAYVRAYNARGGFGGRRRRTEVRSRYQNWRAIISYDEGKTWDWYPPSTW
jgi:hypothetical protein